jgi:hypothetical protein
MVPTAGCGCGCVCVRVWACLWFSQADDDDVVDLTEEDNDTSVVDVRGKAAAVAALAAERRAGLTPAAAASVIAFLLAPVPAAINPGATPPPCPTCISNFPHCWP